MSVVHFQCPLCQAPLRLENRALFVGRPFDCPDCGESLLIEADGNAGVKAKRSSTTSGRANSRPESKAGHPSVTHRTKLETASKVSDRGVDLQSPMSAWDRLSRRPALLGWIVAALCAVMLFVVVTFGRQGSLSELDVSVVAEKKTAETPPQQAADRNQPTAVEPDPASPQMNDQSPDATADVDSAKPNENPDQPPPVATKDLPPDSVPPATDNKPAAEESKPVAVPPSPEPAPASNILSAEAIETKLRQKIARFDQVKPVAFVKLLDTVEELAGVPIVWDLRIADEQFQKLVTIRLKETTVGEILDTLLKQVGLERRILDGKIELLPRTEPEPRL